MLNIKHVLFEVFHKIDTPITKKHNFQATVKGENEGRKN